MSQGHSHMRSSGVKISPADLETVRYSSNGDRVAEAWSRIGEACEDYVRLSHSSGLSEEDIKDIAYDALADWYVLAKTPELTFELVRDELSRALDRHKKRVQRLPASVALDSNMQYLEPAEHIRVVGLMHEIIGVLSPHMDTALRRLKDRYHDLVVVAHGLEGLFELRNPEKREQYAEETVANSRALYRALERFRALLEESLLLALDGSGNKRLALELALKIVRADLVEELLGFGDEF